jgi:hypothetical protein
MLDADEVYPWWLGLRCSQGILEGIEVCARYHRCALGGYKVTEVCS